MPEVIIPEDENFERALRRFKKKCERAAYYRTSGGIATTRSPANGGNGG
jgi:hypothetical protein